MLRLQGQQTQVVHGVVLATWGRTNSELCNVATPSTRGHAQHKKQWIMHRKIANAIGLYMEGIRDGKIEEAIHKYTGDRYTQHNTHVKDGKEGFIEFFHDFIRRNPKRDIQIIRSLVDGDYVFCHAYQNLNNGQAQWVTMDFFLTDENDKLIEHWDTIAEYAPATPSGHTSIDGPAEVTDLDKTEANKALVRQLIQDVLMPGGDPSKIDQYISAETYIQHNPERPDGLEHFKKLAMMPNRPLHYHEIFLMVGQGNFVATLCKAHWDDGTLKQDYAQSDLFRIEHGKVVEHWDCAEAIPPKEEWVNSGKF
jgi:predicted SnoaL-like aldol condensation-catalyzing enzyme